MLAGAHEVVIPAGEDAPDRETAPLNPPIDWREIVENAVWPDTNASVFGSAVIEKSGLAGAVTVTEIDVVWTSDSFVPVTVTVYDPGVDPPRVHVDVWVPLMPEGTHVTLIPAGEEVAVRSTVPVKPPVECREIVEVAERPESNETDSGVAVSAKSGPPELKNSSGDGAVTSPCPRLPPPQTSSISFRRE